MKKIILLIAGIITFIILLIIFGPGFILFPIFLFWLLILSISIIWAIFPENFPKIRKKIIIAVIILFIVSLFVGVLSMIWSDLRMSMTERELAELIKEQPEESEVLVDRMEELREYRIGITVEERIKELIGFLFFPLLFLLFFPLISPLIFVLSIIMSILAAKSYKVLYIRRIAYLSLAIIFLIALTCIFYIYSVLTCKEECAFTVSMALLNLVVGIGGSILSLPFLIDTIQKSRKALKEIEGKERSFPEISGSS